MLKQMLLIGAAAMSFPALAQTTAPAADPAAPTTAAEPAPMPDSTMPTDPATTPAPAPDASAPSAATEPAPAAGTAATPTQIAQIVEKEFPTYDVDANGDLNDMEFAAWMKKLRAATEPSVDPESAEVKTWIDQAFAAADGDKSGAINKTELTGFLSRGA